MNNPLPVVLIGTIAAILSGGTAHAQISSPLNIPGSILWLDGDDLDGNGVKDTGVSGSTFLDWVDKATGDGVQTVSVTAGAPTIDYGVVGTHNAVRFVGGSMDKLDNAAFNIADNYTVFTVVRGDAVGGGHVLSGINNLGTDAVLYRPAGGTYRFYTGQTGGGVDTPFLTRSTEAYRLFGYQVSSTGGDLGFVQSVHAPFEAAGSAQLNGIRIGNLDRAESIAQSEAWNGHIAEVIVYNRTLTAAERSDVSSYLNQKFNLGAAFATGRVTETETGQVSGGSPSTLLPTSEPVASGRINAALPSNGGLAFAKDFIGPADPRNFRPLRLNDGLYSDLPEGADQQEPWIAATHDSFAGIKLGMAMTIDRIGFEDQFLNRRNGAFILEYTLDDLSAVPTNLDLGLDPSAISAKNWQVLDVLQIQDAADTRHLYSFAPITGVTGLRLRLEATGDQIAISELEVWAAPEPATAGLVLAGSLPLLLRRRRILN
jgi:hypothetical protein